MSAFKTFDTLNSESFDQRLQQLELQRKEAFEKIREAIKNGHLIKDPQTGSFVKTCPEDCKCLPHVSQMSLE
jgi:hypothetical protein